LHAVHLSEGLRRRGLTCLLYLTHPANLESILRNGLLSYNTVSRMNLAHLSIANPGVQRRRTRVEHGRNIHDHVPLYLARRNPMLWAVRSQPRAYVRLRLEAADKLGTMFCDGNAASDETCFFTDAAQVDEIPWGVVRARRWTGSRFPDGTRQRCAEVLIPDSVDPEFIIDVRCEQNGRSSLPPDLQPRLIPDPRFISTEFYQGYD
jgi:ssDNA thymidine ADP-ribosyltransferase, DarT